MQSFVMAPVELDDQVRYAPLANTRHRSEKRGKIVPVLAALAAFSFFVAEYFAFGAALASYRAWRHEQRPASTWLGPAGYSHGGLGLDMIRWLTNSTVYLDAVEVLVEKARRFWWGQQLELSMIPFSVFLTIEGRRRAVPFLWAYLALGHLVSHSFGQTLFYIAMIVTPLPLGQTSSSSARFRCHRKPPCAAVLRNGVETPFVRELKRLGHDGLDMAILGHFGKFLSRRNSSFGSPTETRDPGTFVTTAPTPASRCSTDDDIGGMVSTKQSTHHTLVRNLTFRGRKRSVSLPLALPSPPPSPPSSTGLSRSTTARTSPATPPRLHTHETPGALAPTAKATATPDKPLRKKRSVLKKAQEAPARVAAALMPGVARAKLGRTCHPSERPLTETNLRHQEMLCHFELRFGRRPSAAAYSISISPRASRAGSLDSEASSGGWYADAAETQEKAGWRSEGGEPESLWLAYALIEHAGTNPTRTSAASGPASKHS
ncbi:hypothetical protein P8C59_004870 [Phyllachora maydis]|uniref:Uncharacterized protein n=1 Tax=Phyllachora maydis TaxID=1825666 RepID=A0AAD9I3A8_9PEZI|nr:hypothetical protein P8C59_004870 [Phyllachora maydis]